MKKIITAIIAIMVVALTCVSFVACGGKDIDTTLPEGFGSAQPTQEASVKITSDMSAIEMLMAAEENYYNANFVASTSSGSISTKLLGAVEFKQFVKSDKIRNGSINGDYTQFSNNLSGSIGTMDLVKIWEETYITKTGDASEILFRNVSKGNLVTDQNNATLSIKEGKDFNATETFNDMKSYSDTKAADPSKIWMYDINENTYIADQTTAPVYDSATKTYSFTIVADPNTSTTEYQKQMMYMLKEQSGLTPGDFRFEEIKLEVVLWENGYIKSLKLTESYFMKVAGIISTSITLNSNTAYSYFSTEEGFTLADLEAKKFN